MATNTEQKEMTAVETKMPQPKVTWLKHQLPAVNGPEYRRFRKEHDDQTHVEFISDKAAAALPKDADRNAIIKYLTDTYDTPQIAKSAPVGSEERQLLQYLGQLNSSGWQRLANKIADKIQKRAIAKANSK